MAHRSKMRKGRFGEHAGLGKISEGSMAGRKEAGIHGARIYRTGIGKIGESGMARNRGSILGRRVMVKSDMSHRIGHSGNSRELMEMFGFLLHGRLSGTGIERKTRRSSIGVVRIIMGPERIGILKRSGIIESWRSQFKSLLFWE